MNFDAPRELPCNNPLVAGCALALLGWMLPGDLTAQQVQGEFLATAYANTTTNTKGGLFLVNGLSGTVTSLNAGGDLANSYSIAVDPYDDAVIFVGTRSPTRTGSPSIYRIVTVAGKILSTTRILALAVADQTVYQLRVLGDDLLFLTSTQLGRVPVKGGTPKALLTFSPTTEQATNFACDGRQLYVHLQPTVALLAEHVYRYDLENLGSRVLIYQSPGITYFIPSLTMDGTGNVLLTEVEAFSGAADLELLDPTGKSLNSFRLPFTGGVAGARMDPGGGVVVVAGRRFDTTQNKYLSGFITLLNWKVFKSEFGTSAESYHHLDIRRHEPLHRYGHVCEAQTRWRIEIGATGLPALGNGTYSLQVIGLPGRPALMLAGVHGAMPVPFALSVMGAGTCVLGVSPVANFGFTLDNAGKLTLPAPIPQGLGPVNVDIQWLVADRAANPAGFLSSQVGSVVIR